MVGVSDTKNITPGARPGVMFSRWCSAAKRVRRRMQSVVLSALARILLAVDKIGGSADGCTRSQVAIDQQRRAQPGARAIKRLFANRVAAGGQRPERNKDRASES